MKSKEALLKTLDKSLKTNLSILTKLESPMPEKEIKSKKQNPDINEFALELKERRTSYHRNELKKVKSDKTYVLFNRMIPRDTAWIDST